MNIQDIFSQSRTQMVRLVVNSLGPVRVAKGLTAFEDGKSNWGQCFFGRAFKDEAILHSYDAEETIMEITGIKTRVPIRFVWTAFDGLKATGLNRDQLKDLINNIVREENLKAVDDLLDSIDFDPTKELVLECQST